MSDQEIIDATCTSEAMMRLIAALGLRDVGRPTKIRGDGSVVWHLAHGLDAEGWIEDAEIVDALNDGTLHDAFNPAVDDPAEWVARRFPNGGTNDG